MEQNIVVNGEYTERDPLNVHNKFLQNSQQYIKIKPFNRSVNNSQRGHIFHQLFGNQTKAHKCKDVPVENLNCLGMILTEGSMILRGAQVQELGVPKVFQEVLADLKM